MNPAARLLPKFFIICSVILIATGLAQFLVRPRRDGESPVEKVVNRSAITALLSVAIGILGLLLGLGVLKMPRLG
ncbi:MAG TPA: hypothetical protein VMT03_20335 [Polyangia bacterium]|nr:hypothetical protein [Polyangia bacterium]